MRPAPPCSAQSLRRDPNDIEIAEPSLEQLRMTGTVFEHDVDSWLRTLEAAFPIEVTESAAVSARTRKQIVLRPTR